MTEVRCWAIGIDEVRDMFSADPPLRERLLTISEASYGRPAITPQPGLLGKLGPLLRRPPDAPVISPDTPTPADAEHLVAGRFVPEQRLRAAWVLLRRWLDETAWASEAWELTDRDLDNLDFELARAGVPARHGVRHLWSRDARLTLRTRPGMEVGYQRYDSAVALGHDWDSALPQLDGDAAVTAAGVATFLGQLPNFAETATGAGRPTPDVVTLRTR